MYKFYVVRAVHLKISKKTCFSITHKPQGQGRQKYQNADKKAKTSGFHGAMSDYGN